MSANATPTDPTNDMVSAVGTTDYTHSSPGTVETHPTVDTDNGCRADTADKTADTAHTDHNASSHNTDSTDKASIRNAARFIIADRRASNRSATVSSTSTALDPEPTAVVASSDAPVDADTVTDARKRYGLHACVTQPDVTRQIFRGDRWVTKPAVTCVTTVGGWSEDLGVSNETTAKSLQQDFIRSYNASSAAPVSPTVFPEYDPKEEGVLTNGEYVDRPAYQVDPTSAKSHSEADAKIRNNMTALVKDALKSVSASCEGGGGVNTQVSEPGTFAADWPGIANPVQDMPPPFARELVETGISSANKSTIVHVHGFQGVATPLANKDGQWTVYNSLAPLSTVIAIPCNKDRNAPPPEAILSYLTTHEKKRNEYSQRPVQSSEEDSAALSLGSGPLDFHNAAMNMAKKGKEMSDDLRESMSEMNDDDAFQTMSMDVDKFRLIFPGGARLARGTSRREHTNILAQEFRGLEQSRNSVNEGTAETAKGPNDSVTEDTAASEGALEMRDLATALPDDGKSAE